MNKKLVSIFLSATLIFQVGAITQVSAIGEISCIVNNNYKLENIDKALLEAACDGFVRINENTATLEDLDTNIYRLISLYYGLTAYFSDGKLKETSKKKLFENMEKSCKKFKTTFDISTPKKEKFMIKLLEYRAKELLKLIVEYQKEPKQKKNDVEAYLDKALAALEKYKTVKSPFRELAHGYGCNSNGWGYCQYNEFLRKHSLKNPEGHAMYVSKIADLTKGIVENNFLADKDITLYRYTHFDALANQLVSCKCLDKSKATELLENMLPDYSELAKTLSEKKPTISDPAFLSTSKSSTATAGFGNIKLEIKVKKGTAVGADITGLSGHPDQEEVLLVPNQKLKVIKAEGDDYGRMSITVETVK